jgi:hypothetical protein
LCSHNNKHELQHTSRLNGCEEILLLVPHCCHLHHQYLGIQAYEDLLTQFILYNLFCFLTPLLLELWYHYKSKAKMATTWCLDSVTNSTPKTIQYLQGHSKLHPCKNLKPLLCHGALHSSCTFVFNQFNQVFKTLVGNKSCAHGLVSSTCVMSSIRTMIHVKLEIHQRRYAQRLKILSRSVSKMLCNTRNSLSVNTCWHWGATPCFQTSLRFTWCLIKSLISVLFVGLLTFTTSVRPWS